MISIVVWHHYQYYTFCDTPYKYFDDPLHSCYTNFAGILTDPPPPTLTEKESHPSRKKEGYAFLYTYVLKPIGSNS